MVLVHLFLHYHIPSCLVDPCDTLDCPLSDQNLSRLLLIFSVYISSLIIVPSHSCPCPIQTHAWVVRPSHTSDSLRSSGSVPYSHTHPAQKRTFFETGSKGYHPVSSTGHEVPRSTPLHTDGRSTTRTHRSMSNFRIRGRNAQGLVWRLMIFSSTF